MKIFLAGGTGVIGTQLIPLLVAAGHDVDATTRSTARAPRLQQLGARPVVVDALDGAAVGAAVAESAPDVLINQLTAIGDLSSLRRFDRVFAATNRLRTEGTDHLLAAARAAGVSRVISQSFTGWPNARTGGPTKTEDDPLDDNPPAAQRESLAAIKHLEQAMLDAPMPTVVLRYGYFYGHGASIEGFDAIRARRLPVVGDGAGMWSWIHLDDAATATLAALERGSGIYNIVDDDPVRAAEMIPAIAEILGAPRPRHVPVWAARLLAGEVAVSMFTRARGSSNAKARRELGWAPRWSSWREGMRHEFGGRAALRAAG